MVKTAENEIVSSTDERRWHIGKLNRIRSRTLQTKSVFVSPIRNSHRFVLNVNYYPNIVVRIVDASSRPERVSLQLVVCSSAPAGYGRTFFAACSGNHMRNQSTTHCEQSLVAAAQRLTVCLNRREHLDAVDVGMDLANRRIRVARAERAIHQACIAVEYFAARLLAARERRRERLRSRSAAPLTTLLQT